MQEYDSEDCDINDACAMQYGYGGKIRMLIRFEKECRR